MRRHLDRIDQLILAELRHNARIPVAALGDRVNLSRNAVRQRIERLERDEYIQGYTIVEHTAEARANVTANLFVYRTDRMRGGEVIAALKSVPEVVICDVMSGEFDLFVRLEAPSVDRVRAVWQQISMMTGVRDITTTVTLSTVIDRT
ncbi:Lrp/AsnC family transcriptional regulator [Leucobacter komagatae]|uniref:AsnC family transcriptional regulator n=1 Tax=Leucobacter komagatae TaxID=55969 RepID=A0A0D0IQA2_9MICO|nr:Lrp/AsnC family transcriptional regulator [Leucobacter komagatae]KIP51663.1 AsnC family transcriptional regulator [Leucobacter komagatae]